MKNIFIKDVKQKKNAEFLEVTYSVIIRWNPYNLTYKISGESIDSVPMLCDAVVVNLLYYAVRHGLSYVSDFPISEKLYYNLTKHVIPQLCLINNPDNDMIKIKMPLSKEVYHGEWIGTGISLGVDSFTTIHEYTEKCTLEEYRLTHLVHLKTGAHHGQLGYYNQQTEDELFLAENAKVKEFCQKHKYKLITIETNLHALICTEFGYGFDTTHTYRNLGCILLLQNQFDKYYYASACNLDKFDIKLSKDVAYYEKWLIPHISNESISFYSANTNMTRIQKVAYLSKFEDTYDHLHVCWYATDNCGCCKKCIRTLVTLDVLGVLDKYSRAFNLERYYNNRESIISEVILLRKCDMSYMEIYNFMVRNNYKMPSRVTLFKTTFRIAIQKINALGLAKVLKIVNTRILKK